MDRRAMLGLLAGSVAAAVAACTSPGASSPVGGATPSPPNTGGGGSPRGGRPDAATPAPDDDPDSGQGGSPTSPASSPTTSPTGGRPLFSAPAGIVKVPVPKGTIFRLPGPGQQLALTVDDGTDATVVAAYAELAKVTGLRLTFFVNGTYPSWTRSAPALRPLADSGQVVMANHTWSHPDLRKLSAAAIKDQVRRNETFLSNTYGVSGRPFLRPPYGYHNAEVDRQLADLGYPALVTWLGTLGDDQVITPSQIMAMAGQWFLPQHLVIGHANHPAVNQVMDQLAQLIHTRNLTPVHLGDVYDTSATK